MGRLIDADETIKELKRQRDQYEAHDWVNLRESLINDGYDFAITDVEHIPAVEAIPKDQYETRLKADMVVMLTEIQLEIEELEKPHCHNASHADGCVSKWRVEGVIQQKINALEEIDK